MRLKALLMLVVLLSPNMSVAATPTCKEVLKKADQAIQVQKVEISKLNLALTETRDDNANLRKEVTQAKKDIQAWYHNPWIMGAIGVVAGGLLFTFATR